MNATAVGAITAVGLLLSFFATGRDRVDPRVHGTWWGLFFCFLGSSMGYSAGSASVLYYAIPALIVLASLVALYWREATWAVALLGALLVLNIAGSVLKWDAYSVLTVDILDVFVWLQLMLLYVMVRQYPDREVQVLDTELREIRKREARDYRERVMLWPREQRNARTSHSS